MKCAWINQDIKREISKGSKIEFDLSKVVFSMGRLITICERFKSFRIMKITMKVRPIFHWTPKRIKGHFLVCFIAFLLERELEFKK